MGVTCSFIICPQRGVTMISWRVSVRLAMCCLPLWCVTKPRAPARALASSPTTLLMPRNKPFNQWTAWTLAANASKLISRPLVQRHIDLEIYVWVHITWCTTCTPDFDLGCVVVCCNALQCVAVCCRRRVAVCCSVLQCVAIEIPRMLCTRHWSRVCIRSICIRIYMYMDMYVDIHLKMWMWTYICTCIYV